MNCPKIVFIVPYRNRPQHKFFFSNYLSTILKERDDYEVYFSHQCDIRTFNRGATKNIGFIAVKNKYPNDYKNITFVFNDIDTIPFADIFNYETSPGIVKHFYGFNYALGGIVSITGHDFEHINGFPCFWGWGVEDNVLQKRCEQHQITIDRSQFFTIGNPNILHLFDGVQRIINKKDPWRAAHDDGYDGIQTIHKLKYTIDNAKQSTNPLDNIHVIDLSNFFIINISTFMTSTKFENDNYHTYDLREPLRKIVHPDRIKTHKITYSTDDWSNIPFYPTIEKKQDLIRKYGEQKANDIIEYSYTHSTDPTREVIPNELQIKNTNTNTNTNTQSQQTLTPTLYSNTNHTNQYNNVIAKINQYNLFMKSQINKQHNSNHSNHSNHSNTFHKQIPNKYSSDYASFIGVKPKATTSANIRLGGVYHKK